MLGSVKEREERARRPYCGEERRKAMEAISVSDAFLSG
jgi:hypothetical protein